MAKKKKTSRAVQRHRQALKIAEGMIGENLFALYDSLCDQPFRRRVVTAWRILRGKKLGVK